MSVLKKYTPEDLEILVSTMDRNSLDFLNKIFSKNEISKYQILIVNQTKKDSILKSDLPNVKILNSFEVGLSKSRNLAIQHASKKIGIFADDDIVYVNGFEDKIIEVFNRLESISLATFKIATPEGKDFKAYPLETKKIDKQMASSLSSVEIAFRIQDIRENTICFNTNFGLGSHFILGEEFLFLNNVLKKKLNGYFIPEMIVIHENLSTGKNHSDDKVVFSRAALYYTIMGNLAYFWVIKYVLFLVRKKWLLPYGFFSKVGQGFKGIKKYKDLKNK